MPPIAPRRIHADESLSLGELGPHCIAVWRGAVRKVAFDRQREALNSVVAANTGGAGFVCVIEGTAQAPDDALRRESSQMVTSLGKRLRCVALVVEGEGFQSALHRGVLAGMILFARDRKSEVSVFARVHPAALWAVRYLPALSADALVGAVEQVRRWIPPPA